MQKYPKTESHTPIHTGGGMIESHFWIEIPLKLDNQVIQIKTLVCDSECPYEVSKYEMCLSNLWYSGSDNVFYLVVQYNPLLVGMHD